MPLSNDERRAVLAVSHEMAMGRSVRLTDRSFWSRYGSPRMDMRRDIVSRATALEGGATQSILGDFTGTIGGVFSGTGYPAGDGDTGPLDSPDATVYARLALVTQTGDIAIRTVSGHWDWNDSLEDVKSWLLNMRRQLERNYGFMASDPDDEDMSFVMDEGLFIY